MNSSNPQPIISYDGHSSNVTAVGFQKDGKWMYTGSEDGTGKASFSTFAGTLAHAGYFGFSGLCAPCQACFWAQWPA